MKYYKDGQWKDIQVKVANAIENEYGESNNDGYSQNYINGLNEYSTTEHRVGTWIDGKPLYRKVVQLAPTAINNWEYLDLNNDIEAAINIYGYLKPTNYTQNRYTVLNSSNDFLIQTTTNGKLAIKTSNSAFLTTWYIVLEYTKTTDTVSTRSLQTISIPENDDEGEIVRGEEE